MLTAALSSASPPSTTAGNLLSHHSPSGPSGNSPVHIRIVPHLESSRSLVFDIIERDLRDGTILKIGRFSDRFVPPNRITFRSKVVSRGHAEIWIEHTKIYLRDTGSSSGTFLNHVRLSAPGQQSKACELRDGDVVQLGMDYKGGHEDIYRAVKMRFEFNRNQQQTNSYSINTFQSLRNFMTPPNNISILDAAMAGGAGAGAGTGFSPEDARIEDCCICLYAIAPFQALFVAPCSHTFHFKCCRPLLQNFPGFQCPICRSYANLDASVAIEASEVLEMLKSNEAKNADLQTEGLFATPVSSNSP